MMTGTDNNLDPETTCIRKTAVIDTELSRRNVHIAALQETQTVGTGAIKEFHFLLYSTAFGVSNTIVTDTSCC